MWQVYCKIPSNIIWKVICCFSHWACTSGIILLDIVSDLCAGLIGGLGVAKGANIGLNAAVFEPVHGSAPDIKGQNKANPTALLLSAVDMLKYINQNEVAEKIEKALYKTISEGTTLTCDLGGKATTTDFTTAIIKNL